jgi:hypothetical protein
VSPQRHEHSTNFPHGSEARARRSVRDFFAPFISISGNAEWGYSNLYLTVRPAIGFEMTGVWPPVWSTKSISHAPFLTPDPRGCGCVCTCCAQNARFQKVFLKLAYIPSRSASHCCGCKHRSIVQPMPHERRAVEITCATQLIITTSAGECAV